VRSANIASPIVTGIYGCVAQQCDSHEAIDDTLRNWLDLAIQLRDRSDEPQEDLIACAHVLIESHVFQDNRNYVRTQIIHSFLQEDDAGTLHAITCLLLLDGHNDQGIFPRMIDESCFPRLLELINERGPDDDALLHRLLLHLMYEMSRIERLRLDDVTLVDDAFIHNLFGIIEGVSNDVQDPYHYPTIRVLVRASKHFRAITIVLRHH
jgi:stress-induced morphogen